MDVNILINSTQSSSKLFDSVSDNIPDSFNNSIQYSVSLASFKAMLIFAAKSGFVCPRIPSFTLAPILVPLLSNCFERTNSLFSVVRY